MQATISQPASPIPQPPSNQPFSEAFERRLREWEAPAEPTRPEVPKVEVTNVSTGQTRPVKAGSGTPGSQNPPPNLLKEAPIRAPLPAPAGSNVQPNPQPPPNAKPMRSETAPVNIYPLQEPHAVSRRSETAPVGHAPIPNGPMSPQVALPSADQLARLNSRKGRPRGLSDPRRVSTGSSPQPRPNGGNHNRVPSGGPINNTPPHLTLEPGWNGPQRLTPEQAFRTSQISSAGSPQRNQNHSPSLSRHLHLAASVMVIRTTEMVPTDQGLQTCVHRCNVSRQSIANLQLASHHHISLIKPCCSVGNRVERKEVRPRISRMLRRRVGDQACREETRNLRRIR